MAGKCYAVRTHTQTHKYARGGTQRPQSGFRHTRVCEVNLFLVCVCASTPQVDCHAAEGAEFDGVAVFDHVHNDYVSSLVWASNPGSSATATNHLLTTSYDGSIRLLDVGEVRHVAGQRTHGQATALHGHAQDASVLIVGVRASCLLCTAGQVP